MTKLQLLNQYLTKRLMVVVQEIVEVVGDAVSEYREETVRTQRENESLRRRLRQYVIDTEQHAACAVQLDTVLNHGLRSPAQPQCEEHKCQSVLIRELDVWEEEQKSEEALAKPISDSATEPEPGLKKLALEIALSVVSPSSSVKAELNAIHTAERQPCRQAEYDSLAQTAADLIKTEPSELKLKSEEVDNLCVSVAAQERVGESAYDSDLTAAPEISGSGTVESGATRLPGDAHLCVSQLGENRHDSDITVAPEVNGNGTVESGAARLPGDAHRCVSQPGENQQRCLHCGKRPYVCHWCGKSFSQSADLRRHQRIHTGEKPHRCSWCEKSFTQIGNLKRHLRIHTGERPYCCTLCGRKFNDGDTLKKHMRTHTGERPFCCPLCSKTFTVSCSLQNHLRNHRRDHRKLFV